jgi:hypothetical protein
MARMPNGQMGNRPLARYRPPPWNDRADAIVRTLHPEVAAKKLGISVAKIEARRVELGLPTVQAQFADVKGNYPRYKQGTGTDTRWTNAEIRIVKANTAAKAQRLLPHRTASSIHTLRIRLRRSGVKLKEVRAVKRPGVEGSAVGKPRQMSAR